MATESAAAPTQWDLTNVYSSLDGEDYRAATERLKHDLAELQRYFDAQRIDRQPTPPAAEGLTPVLEQVLDRVNRISLSIETLDAFVTAFVTTNSYDDLAQREMSKLELLDAEFRKLRVRLAGWLGSLESLIPQACEQSEACRRHRFYLEHTARESRYLMSAELEALAAELCIDGGGAFGKLQGNVTSQLKWPLELDGKVEELPITVIRNLCFHPEADVRRRAYDAELQAWHSVRTPVAAALNGVKGTAITLHRRRGRANVLESALVYNRIDQPTLDALLGAIREAFPIFRRYLSSKARKLGQQQLPWWDIFAPLGAAEQSFTWGRARDFIVEKFSAFAPELGEYAALAFDRRWIDGAPRDGKRGGAFCMAVPGVDESRILANFDGSFEQVSTLSHELGHGFHNHCQRELPALLRGSPSTLAETASIFCETLAAEAALEDASPAEELMILEAQLANACQVCLDITSRFHFESAFIRRRSESELSPDEICQLMLEAQADAYGDGVQPATYHRYMWLWKPHYYSYEHNFYNFPYAFGHLFGLGLYAQFQQEGESFVPRYEQLLRDTNTDYAAPLARRFGIDITQRDFWRQSLAIVEQQVQRYEKLEA